MGEVGNLVGHIEAQAMLEAFASVGAVSFDVTWTTRCGDKEFFRRGVSLVELTRTMPAMLDNALDRQRNVIVRPYGPAVRFVQLDDLKSDQLLTLAPAVFLILNTSPGSFQAWVALPAVDDKDFERRLRKGTGADPTASGATRVCGSLNFKDKYAPDFPRIMIRQTNAGLITTTTELEGLGLVSRPETEQPLSVAPPRSSIGRNRKWPSYARCLDGAPPNRSESGPDISRADFVFCMTAITWGWTVDETAARLMQESIKAQENGNRYAKLTAQNAALAVDRRGDQLRPHRVSAPERIR